MDLKYQPAFLKLSQELERLDIPQQTDKFVKEIRRAILDEQFDASYAGETFELPKVFRRRHKGEEGQTITVEARRRVAEMVIKNGEAYQNWFNLTQRTLYLLEHPEGSRRQRNDITPSADELIHSADLFAAGVRQTRARLKKKRDTGQMLASSDGFRPQYAPEDKQSADNRSKRRAAKKTTDNPRSQL